MRSSSLYIEWSELFASPLPDDLIDLWRAAQSELGIDAQALSATSTQFQASMPDQALRIVDVVSEVDAVHDVDVGAVIMTISQQRELDDWAPSVRHAPQRVAQLQALHAQGVRIGIVSESVWSRSWVQRFLARDQVPSDALIVANEGNMRLHYPDAWGEAIMRLGPGIAICSDERKAQGARTSGLAIHTWEWIDERV